MGQSYTQHTGKRPVIPSPSDVSVNSADLRANERVVKACVSSPAELLHDVAMPGCPTVTSIYPAPEVISPTNCQLLGGQVSGLA